MTPQRGCGPGGTSLRASLAATALAIVLALPLGPRLGLPAAGAHAEEVTHHVVVTHEGTPIAITVFRPEGASAQSPVPVILRGHGWSGSRDKTDAGRVGALLDAGYGVVTFDARGHGESGGEARVHHWDHEIEDVRVLLDWVHDNLPWVEREPSPKAAKDIRVGGSGGSYGGGWQLLAAAKDARLDVLVPEITWNNLPQSLAPNGAIKSDWVALLYAAGVARVRMHASIHEGFAEAAATNDLPEGFAENLTLSSPSAHIADIRVPTLLVQGVPDTLFNLNEAAANFEGIRANGAPAKLFTHLGGHLLHARALSGGAPDVGLQPGDQGSPCGSVQEQALRWYDRWLKGLAVDTGPAVELAMDDGSCLRGESLGELANIVRVPRQGPILVEGSVLVRLPEARSADLAGIPRLTVSYVNRCEPWTVYASLVAVHGDAVRVLDAQVTPLRGPRLGEPCPAALTLSRSVDLGGVGASLQPGETLALKLDTWNEQYALHSERWPQTVVLTKVVVELPLASR